MSRVERDWWLCVGSDGVVFGAFSAGAPSASENMREVAMPGDVTSRPFLAIAVEALVRLARAIANDGSARAGALHVLVSDRWITSTLLAWTPALRRRDSTLTYARVELEATGAELSADDVVRVADARYRALRTAVAYPGELLAALRAFGQSTGLRLRSVRPLALSVATQLRRSGSLRRDALAVVEGQVATLLQRVSGRWLPLAAPVVLAPAEDPASLVAGAWQRLRLRQPSFGLTDPLPVVDLRSDARAQDWAHAEGVQWHPRDLEDSTTPPSLWPWPALARASAGEERDLDAIDLGRPQSPLAWSGAVLMSVLALGAGIQAWSLLERQRAIERELGMRARVAEVPRRPVRSREDEFREAAVQAAVAQLNLPAAALLAALPPPRDLRVALLAAELIAGGGSGESSRRTSTLRLTAESPTTNDMARYVAYLADRSPIERAHLVSHEVVEGTGRRGFRFTVEAAWRD